MNTIPVHVTAITIIACDIKLVELAASDGAGLPEYNPGSHIDLYLGPSLVRQYSLCGNQDGAGQQRRYLIAVKKEPQSRGGSATVHERLRVGETLRISAPRNFFPMVGAAPVSVLVAAGIGITPIISMARSLQKAGQAYQLLYFCRSAEHAAFLKEIETPPMAAHSKTYLGLSRDELRQSLREAIAPRPEGAQLYMCGPQGFMDLLKEIAGQTGWPDSSVHQEYFGGAGQPGTPSSTNKAFQVKLALSGSLVNVSAELTLIDALRAHGINVQASCEQGVCGTCITPVLEGAPEHRDCFLTDAEKSKNDCMAICVSRALTPLLVLEL